MTVMRAFVILMLVTLGVMPAIAQDARSPQELCNAADAAELTKMQFEAAADVLQAETDYRAILCTSAGAIYIDLYEKLTPITVNNFVFLAGEGYYDSTTFHRVIPNFMAQGGDPTGTGRGGPGYRFGDEPVGWLTFDSPGLLAMANAGPGTNGSQFFITTAPTPHLNYKHTIFGDVLSGQDVVESIRERDPATASDAGEGLLSVLIITDPAEVDSSEIEPLAPATQEQISATFDAFTGSMPPALPADPAASGRFSVAELAANLPADLQAPFADYAEQYGLQYRQRAHIRNVNCDANIYFTALGYQVDVFADAAAAAAALGDALTARMLQSQGYQPVAGEDNSYSVERPTCADEAGEQAISLYTYGRYLVAIDVHLATRVLEGAGVSASLVLANLAQQIEPGFAAIYRPEIRA